jgi:Winged helix DNA-binding domain
LCKEDTGRLDRAEGLPSVGTAREPAPYPKVRWRSGEDRGRSGAATRWAAQDGVRPPYHPGMVRPAIAPHALPELSARQLNRTTLLRQSLLERSAEDTTTAVRRLGGLQAQYANSPYIALWSRLDAFAIGDLERALAERSVVKASVVRATLHVVAADDYPALSVATAVARMASWRPSADRVGIRTVDLHRRLLDFAETPRTLAEMEAHLEAVLPDSALTGKVPAGVNHVGFRMADSHGWLIHVPPSGHWGSFARPRYIDASAWLPGVTPPDADDALRVAVERYLGAFGPASDADIGKWIGQPRLPRVRAAIAALGDRIRRFRDPAGRELVDLIDAPLATGDEPAPVRFLARWDEVLIGYDRRERILPEAVAGDVIRRKNGDFLPSFTVDGYVAGTWSVASSAAEAILDIVPSLPVTPADRRGLTDEAERLVRFVAPDAARHGVRWPA